MPEIIKYINQNNQITNHDFECYILDTSLDKDYITEFVNKASSLNKIVLFMGNNEIEYANFFSASGVVLDFSNKEKFPKDLGAIKKLLPKNSIIGLISRNRRHEAMLTSELEPDFIIFNAWNDGLNKTIELLDWYNDFFIIQSAVFLKEETIDTSQINSDFIIY